MRFIVTLIFQQTYWKWRYTYTDAFYLSLLKSATSILFDSACMILIMDIIKAFKIFAQEDFLINKWDILMINWIFKLNSNLHLIIIYFSFIKNYYFLAESKQKCLNFVVEKIRGLMLKLELIFNRMQFVINIRIFVLHDLNVECANIKLFPFACVICRRALRRRLLHAVHNSDTFSIARKRDKSPNVRLRMYYFNQYTSFLLFYVISSSNIWQ